MRPEPGDCPVPGVRLRHTQSADEPFLRALYRSVRESELALTDWNEAQKAAFANQQFDAQDRSYRVCEDASFFVIEREGTPVGRIILQATAGELRVMDIALVPAARGSGLGTALMRWICETALRQSRDVTLYVEMFNPAGSLYARLGFAEESGDGVYRKLRWRRSTTG